jgi:hypothetical protein
MALRTSQMALRKVFAGAAFQRIGPEQAGQLLTTQSHTGIEQQVSQKGLGRLRGEIGRLPVQTNVKLSQERCLEHYSLIYLGMA